jgi:metal-responsive CopG/Arc/MetJ family transcriptional regulator
MARRKLSDAAETVQLNLRVPADLVARLDALLEARRTATPGVALSRADVVREALYRVVEEHERARKRRR